MHLHFPEAPQDAADDLAECRALLRNGSKTFFAASYLLPHHVRMPATALYAFCRLADDAIDNGKSDPTSIARLERRLQRAYAGNPWPHPADRAFARATRDHAIPSAVPAALLEGLAWDAAGRRYETIGDLHAYAARVAGTVGVMMALVMGVRSASLLARACDLGMAMQLSNIARDVGEDARAGRLYLPRAWLDDAGIDPESWLAAPRHSPALASVIERVLSAADDLYRRADAGIAELPVSCRRGIRTARLLYAEIGHQVRRNGHDSVSQRAVVTAGRKLVLISHAVAPARPRPALRDEPAMPQARFLIDASAGIASESEAATAWWDMHAQGVRLIEIWERLERRERAEVWTTPALAAAEPNSAEVA